MAEPFAPLIGAWPIRLSGAAYVSWLASCSVVVTVPLPAGSAVGAVDRAAVTGVPIKSVPVPVAPGIGTPEVSVTVTVIVSSPRMKLVVLRVPKSTVLSVASTLSVVLTGDDVRRTVLLASVTTKPTLA